jgi:hypothetical protein
MAKYCDDWLSHPWRLAQRDCSPVVREMWTHRPKINFDDAKIFARRIHHACRRYCCCRNGTVALDANGNAATLLPSRMTICVQIIKARTCSATRDVRFGPIADMCRTRSAPASFRLANEMSAPAFSWPSSASCWARHYGSFAVSSSDYHVRMTTHTRFDFIGVAVVLAYLLNALFAIVLAALLLFLLTYMG